MNEIFRLDTYFSHHGLILQLLDAPNRAACEARLREANQYTFNLKDYYINRTFQDALLNHLREHHVAALVELLATNTPLKTGMLVWLEAPFYFKGVTRARIANDGGKRPAYFTFKTTLEDFGQLSISGQLNAAHLASDSALSALSGKANKFMVGYVHQIEDGELTLRSLLVGDKMLTEDLGLQWDNFSLQLNLADIDEFSKAAKIGYKNPALSLDNNRLIPEKQVKEWFAEIIGEGNVDKDWGGEQSDLFTAHLHIKGRQVSAAFLLKGPSKFHPMAAKDLGKNGDQIVRLFDQPAELFILQHCHYVTPAVRKQMDAFASRFYKPGRYLVIDGIDTQRILKAYGKL